MFKGGIEVSNTLTIKGHLSEVSLKAIEQVYSIIGPVNLQIFNMLVALISNILIIGFNAILSVGIYLPDIFPFLKPLELSEIDIYLSEYYLAVEALPVMNEEVLKQQLFEGLKTYGLGSSLSEETGTKLKGLLLELVETTSYEDAKPYLQHSNLQPIKPFYKILKMVESLVNMNEPDFKFEAKLDDL